MKQREPRRKVLIDARLRQGTGWTDARILDMSSRGLGVRTAKPPQRGTYIEICKGTHRIVARVVWADNDRFGVRTQDIIAVDAIASGAEAAAPKAASLGMDRRSAPRQPPPADALSRSRQLSRRLEFLAVAAFGCAAAFVAFDAVRDTLARPIGLVEAKLGAGG